eukprot:scaffold43790_cov38-Cyclotella_meneghiniana.AAC.8
MSTRVGWTGPLRPPTLTSIHDGAGVGGYIDALKNGYQHRLDYFREELEAEKVREDGNGKNDRRGGQRHKDEDDDGAQDEQTKRRQKED